MSRLIDYLRIQNDPYLKFLDETERKIKQEMIQGLHKIRISWKHLTAEQKELFKEWILEQGLILIYFTSPERSSTCFVTWAKAESRIYDPQKDMVIIGNKNDI